MFLVQCEKLRINHLTLLLVVTMPYACWFLWWADYIEGFKWSLRFQFGVMFWRVVLTEVLYIWRAKLRLKGIEDFDLEHWLQVFNLKKSLVQKYPLYSQPFKNKGGPITLLARDEDHENFDNYAILLVKRKFWDLRVNTNVQLQNNNAKMECQVHPIWV